MNECVDGEDVVKRIGVIRCMDVGVDECVEGEDGVGVGVNTGVWKCGGGRVCTEGVDGVVVIRVCGSVDVEECM